MNLGKRITQSRLVQEALGRGFASYVRLVQRTNRFAHEPADLYRHLVPLQPFIGAMWHGQHLLAPLMRRPDDRAASLVSRSRDGELNAIALRQLGISAIRGSGARGRDQRQKGGASALRAMLRALEDGENMFLTADIPKIARQCGSGIVTLARMSGRPIVPAAVATSRRIVFDSWDRTSLGLPLGRGLIAAGAPIWVPREADEATCETARIEVERALDGLHRMAFERVGQTDPGADLRAATVTR